MFLSFLFSPRHSDLSGKWIDDEALTSGVEYGFVLSENGAAKSVGISSPEYTAWRKSGSTLTLWGHAYNPTDNARIDFIESLKIQRIGDDKMILSRNDEEYSFTRR